MLLHLAVGLNLGSGSCSLSVVMFLTESTSTVAEVVEDLFDVVFSPLLDS